MKRLAALGAIVLAGSMAAPAIAGEAKLSRYSENFRLNRQNLETEFCDKYMRTLSTLYSINFARDGDANVGYCEGISELSGQPLKLIVVDTRAKWTIASEESRVSGEKSDKKFNKDTYFNRLSPEKRYNLVAYSKVGTFENHFWVWGEDVLVHHDPDALETTAKALFAKYEPQLKR